MITWRPKLLRRQPQSLLGPPAFSSPAARHNLPPHLFHHLPVSLQLARSSCVKRPCCCKQQRAALHPVASRFLTAPHRFFRTGEAPRTPASNSSSEPPPASSSEASSEASPVVVPSAPVPDSDCVVSAWSEWTRLQNQLFKRSRYVLEPQGGAGTACPVLLQTTNTPPNPKATVSLAMDFAYVAQNRAAMELAFAEDAARAMGIPASRVKVKNMEPGSVTVTFEVEPAGGESAAAASAKLDSMANTAMKTISITQTSGQAL